MIDGMARDMYPYSEHRAVEAAFYQVVGPDTRSSAADALGYALGRGVLDDAGAEPLLAKLWTSDEARHAYQENEPPLAG